MPLKAGRCIVALRPCNTRNAKEHRAKQEQPEASRIRLCPRIIACFPKVYAGPYGVDVSRFLKVKPGNAPNKIAVLSGAEMVRSTGI